MIKRSLLLLKNQLRNSNLINLNLINTKLIKSNYMSTRSAESIMNGMLGLNSLNKYFEPKSIASTHVISMEMANSGFDSVNGYIKGGSILSKIDLVATHCIRKLGGAVICPTRSMDAVHFMSPIKLGSIIIFKAQINRTWNTSTEVQVMVEVDDLNGQGPRFCCSSLLTFVLIKGPRDENDKMRLPQVFPETSAQRQAFDQAQLRRNKRLSHSKQYSLNLEAFRKYLMSQEAQVRPTYAESSHTILPSQANNIDTLFGGQIMNWMESNASIAATRHAKSMVMSASSDAIQFVKPSRVGDVIILRSIVTQVFNRSMEVYVLVTKLEPGSSTEEFTNDGFFTFVAIDSKSQNKKLLQLPSLNYTSQAEIEMAKSAELRRANRNRELLELAPPKL